MSQWLHKINKQLTLLIKEEYPTVLVGEVWNPHDPDEDTQCMTINVSYEGLLEMWESDENYNQTRIS
jgi:hypothetical protein